MKEQVFKACLFDEFDSIYPDSDCKNGKTEYTVSGCNGTYAGVTILLNGLTPGIPVTIEVEGDNKAFKFFKMIPLPVEVNTGAKLRSAYLKNDVNETVIRKAPFMVYEVLEPIFNMFTPQFKTEAISFKTIIEYVKREYTETFNIKISHGGNSTTLKFNVEKFPAKVKKADKYSFKYVNWLSYDNIAYSHRIEKWSKEYDKLFTDYLRTAHYSRQNILNIPLSEVFTHKDEEIIFNKDRLSHIILLAKKAGIELFQGSGFCMRAESLADDDEFYNSLKHNEIENANEILEAFKIQAFEKFDNGTDAKLCLTNDLLSTQKGIELLKRQAKMLYDYLVENNLISDWMQCVLDEPNDALADTYKNLTAAVKSVMPGIKLIEPVLPGHKIEGTLDIYCPSTDVYETDKDFYDAQIEKGKELFVYTCLTPGGNYMNRMLDMQRIRQVYLGWIPVIYPNIEGFLHWGLNQGGTVNPYKRQAQMFSENVLEFHPKLSMFLPAGDMAIFFAGYNEPLISTRSEAHRIGLEDLELFTLLDTRIAENLARKLVRGFADYDKSIENYRKVKRELLEIASV